MANPNWMKGQSGNPRGRPMRGTTFKELLDAELKKLKYTLSNPDGTITKVNGKKAIIQAHLSIIFSKTATDEARMRAIDSMYDRCDGRPKQQTELSGPDGGPIVSLSMDGEERKRIFEELIASAERRKINES
jgi:uncharacterized protein YlzI (FlbEa/FlbD family)